MNTINVCLIQARMESSRLPGKVLLPLYKAMCAIDVLYERLLRSSMITEIIFIIPEVCTSDALHDYIQRLGANVVRGSANDLVARHLQAISSIHECNIVRITSDCPLVDPAWVDKCIYLHNENRADYTSTYTPAAESLFCNGADIEVFSKSMLKHLYAQYPSQKDREHVTFPLWDGRMKHIKHLKMSRYLEQDFSDARLTLDYQEDLEVIRNILSDADDIHLSLESLVLIYRKLSCNKQNGSFDFAAGW